MNTMYFTVKPKSPAAEAVDKLFQRSKDQTDHAYATLKAQGVPMTKGFSVCSLHEQVVGFGHDDRATLMEFINANQAKWKYKLGYALPNHKTPEGRAVKKALLTIPKDITGEDMDEAFTGDRSLGMMRVEDGGFCIPHCGIRAMQKSKLKPMISIPTTFVIRRKNTLVEGLIELSQSAVLKLKAQYDKGD